MDIETFDIKPMEAGVILNISSPTLSIDGQTILVPPLATVLCNLKAREGQKLSGIKASEDFDVIFDLTPETVLITDFASNIINYE